MATAKAALDFLHGGRVARLTLRAPKANVLDRAMIAALDDGLRHIEGRTDLLAIVIASEGPHFSFGASVEEHLPDSIASTLSALHGLLRRLLGAPAPTIAAVRGQCVGGGLELVLACDLIVAHENAQLGCPEIKLGVFPPAASVLLPVRVGAARASALTLLGASISGREAAAIGLAVRATDGDVDAVVEQLLAESFLPRSAAGLRFAAAAVRESVRRAFDDRLPEAERLYLDGLMREPDAVEGIRAFLEKRDPRWSTGVVV